MEIVIKTVLRQIITQSAGTQDIIKKLASCDPCGRKRRLKTIAFLLRLSIYRSQMRMDDRDKSGADYFLSGDISVPHPLKMNCIINV